MELAELEAAGTRLAQVEGALVDGRDVRLSWGSPLPEKVVERIAYELDTINNMGFSQYFLITWDLIRHARDLGIRMCPGGDLGCAWCPHGAYAKDIQVFVDVIGFSPLEAIGAATRWPARFLKQEKNLGTLAEGRMADVIAVRGDVLSNVTLLQNVNIVVKGGVRVK